jgi:hypothetical protein
MIEINKGSMFFIYNIHRRPCKGSPRQAISEVDMSDPDALAGHKKIIRYA